MLNKRKIRFGTIGCGNAGSYRTRTLAAHPLGVQISAVADLEMPNLDRLASTLGYDFVRYTGDQDYRRLIDENDLDAVGIFTPHALHYDHVKYAIRKGLHVLIEKPMVCGVANALEITRLMRESGKIGIVHYQRHYEEKYVKARELIKQGFLGDIKHFFIYMAQDWYGKTWRGEPELSGGGQINDSGSHYQDILLWMLNALPISAEGTIDSIYRGKKGKVEYNGSFNVELNNGANGRIIIISDIPGGFRDDVRIVGTKGSFLFQDNRLIFFDAQKNTYNDIPLRKPKNYPDSPCDNFVKMLYGKNRINRVPFIFGCRVALLTEAMLRSGHNNGKKIFCADILKESKHSLTDLETE